MGKFAQAAEIAEANAAALLTPVVVDGRNLFEPAVMAALGLEYSCIGRAAQTRLEQRFDGSIEGAGQARRGRWRHSAEFKAQVAQACCRPGVSIASVALSYGLNDNLLRRW